MQNEVMLSVTSSEKRWIQDEIVEHKSASSMEFGNFQEKSNIASHSPNSNSSPRSFRHGDLASSSRSTRSRPRDCELHRHKREQNRHHRPEKPIKKTKPFQEYKPIALKHWDGRAIPEQQCAKLLFQRQPEYLITTQGVVACPQPPVTTVPPAA
jgi:hypothetical protein